PAHRPRPAHPHRPRHQDQPVPPVRLLRPAPLPRRPARPPPAGRPRRSSAPRLLFCYTRSTHRHGTRVIRSITGFCEASAEVGGVHYFIEVRSLNSKFFKATIRLPEAFQGLEAEMESALRRRLARGTVTLTAICTDISESAAFEINYRALDRYIEQIR